MLKVEVELVYEIFFKSVEDVLEGLIKIFFINEIKLSMVIKFICLVFLIWKFDVNVLKNVWI